MDPYFDAVTAELRGFDLGDDDELLGELVRRRAQTTKAMGFADWMLLGVLMHRAGADEEALSCFEEASAMGTHVPLPRYLQAQLFLDRGQPDDAEALLDLAEEHNEHDPAIPPAELVHARGSAALSRGDTEGALSYYAAALRLDDSSCPRWLDLANLCRALGRLDDACEAAQQATQADPEFEPAYYSLACAAAEAGYDDVALDALQLSFELAPERRHTAFTAPEFEGLREHPGFGPLFEEPSPAEAEPDLSWLDVFPTWLQMLRSDPVLTEAGVRWLDGAESEARSQGLRALYDEQGGPRGVAHTDATLRLSRKQARRARVVARGPASYRRDGTEEVSWFIVDEQEPTRLFIALTEDYPPFLWLDAGAAQQSVHDTVAEYFPQPVRDRRSLRGKARGFMGYRGRFGVASPTGDLVPADELGLDHHFALCPFLEPGSWGSAYADDPWPEHVPEQPNSAPHFERRQRETNRQADGAVWSRTRRTRHSRSYLAYELHHEDVFVVDVRYAPSRQTAVVERMNAHFGCDYPRDMPVDVIAALLGFGFDSASDLQNELETTADPQALAGLLSLLSALRHSDLSMFRVFRRYMDHPDAVVRTTLWNVFAAYNFESLLEEAVLIEEDPVVLEQLHGLLDGGIPMLTHDDGVEAAS
jgi:tetratricopeptide (TPR) repeat protein